MYACYSCLKLPHSPLRLLQLLMMLALRTQTFWGQAAVYTLKDIKVILINSKNLAKY